MGDKQKLDKQELEKQKLEKQKLEKQRLQEKLNLKRENLRSARNSGMNPQMNKVRKMMGDKEFQESKEMMQDLGKSTKNKKDAKKLMKNMSSGMNSDEMDKISSMIKSKVPNASKEMDNMMKKTKTKQICEETAVLTIVETKIYVPASKLSENDKKQRKSEILIKKKKQFTKMEVRVPKISDLRETTETVNKSNDVKQLALLPQVFENPEKDINALFSQLKYTPELKRLKAISEFSSSTAFNSLQLKLMQQGGDLVKIVKIIDFPLQKFIGLPGSEEIVEFPPKDWNGKNIYCDEKFGYKMIAKQCIKSKNHIDACNEYVKKLSRIREWITSLQSKTIGLSVMCEMFNDYGIIRKEDISPSILTFYAYCEESIHNNKNDKISVPQIPLFYMKI